MCRPVWRGVLAFGLLVLVVGCLQAAPAANERPQDLSDPPPVEPCPDGVDRLSVGVDDGALPSENAAFRLTASDEVVRRGETVEFSLRNVADERRHTGTQALYLLQRRGPDGWRTVLGVPPERRGWNATALSHPPGQGFDWTITMSEPGLSSGRYVPCGSLPPGEYRFVYFGVSDPDATGAVGETAVATRFRLVADESIGSVRRRSSVTRFRRTRT